MAGNVYSVSQVNQYVKNMFNQDFFLRSLSVQGEVSNLKYHTSGHIYFSLKEEGSLLACVMFAGQRRGLTFDMKSGDKVVVTGSLSVYERDGKYQLYATRISLDGKGVLYERFLQLKAELEEMGMFDPSYKKPIPKHVKRVGIATAPTGAAIQDIRNVSLRRNPFVELILYPALVQGDGAKESVCRGIRMLDALGVDVIIVGRGGGSLEDLWAFNEEMVARAIFECRTPVISAVGHETDVTIADFVSDKRAPTPSAAAELAVEDVSVTFERLSGYRKRLSLGMQRRYEGYRQLFAQLSRRFQVVSPSSLLLEKRQHLSDLEEDLARAMDMLMRDKKNRLALLAGRLDGLSPMKKLEGGYSYVAGADGRAINSLSQVKEGDSLSVYVTDGVMRVLVTDNEEKK